MSSIIQRFTKDRAGATAIEYVLLAALIAVAIIAGATMLGTEINNTFTEVTDALQGAQPAGN